MKTNAVKILIAANVAVFILQLLAPNLMLMQFALWPLQPIEGEHLFQPWQVLTYAFLHSTTLYAHLLLNMWGVWMFGGELERYVGARRLLACYFASVVTAALTQLLVPTLLGTEPEPILGASGGVFGLLLAYAWLFPRNRVALIFAPIPIPARIFAALYAGVELFLGVTGYQASVAHFAHLGGMVGAALVVWQWRRRKVT